MSDYGVLLVPASRDGSVRVRLQAVPASGEGELTFIALRVNDVFEATPIAMSSTPSAYEWVIPATAWVAGTNELLLTVSSTVRSTSQHTDGRSLGLAFQKITLTLIEDQETTR